jgi:hypothetical protein
MHRPRALDRAATPTRQTAARAGVGVRFAREAPPHPPAAPEEQRFGHAPPMPPDAPSTSAVLVRSASIVVPSMVMDENKGERFIEPLRAGGDPLACF